MPLYLRIQAPDLALHLTEENCDRLLGRATHKSRREVEELVPGRGGRLGTTAFKNSWGLQRAACAVVAWPGSQRPAILVVATGQSS